MSAIDTIAKIIWILVYAFVLAVYLMLTLLTDLTSTLTPVVDGILYGAFGLASVFFGWCYIRICWCDPGSTDFFYRKYGLYTNGDDGNFPSVLKDLPKCGNCSLPKPPRTHHCSRCDKCFFRFDHHCPVYGTCIALNNYKAFILLPFYGGIVLIIPFLHILLGVIPYMAVVLPLLYIAIIAPTFGYCKDTCTNATTLEGIAEVPKETFSSGGLTNFMEIFGPWYLIPFPTKPQVSGFHWCDKETEDKILESLRPVQNTESTSQLQLLNEETL